MFDVREVADPAELRIDRPRDVNRDAKGMPMQAGTFVAGWDVRKPMGGFEVEFLEDFV